MKNMKRILAVVLTMVVLCAAIVISVIATDDAPAYTGTAADLETKVAAAEALEAEGVSIYTSVTEAVAYYNDNTFDPAEQEQIDAVLVRLKAMVVRTSSAVITYPEDSSVAQGERFDNLLSAVALFGSLDVSDTEGYADVAAAIEAQTKAIVDEALAIEYVADETTGFYNTAENGISLNRASYILKNYASEWENLAELQASLDALRVTHKEMMAANKAVAEGATSLADYQLPVIMNHTFETFPDNAVGNKNRNFAGSEVQNGEWVATVRYVYHDYEPHSDGKHSANTFYQFNGIKNFSEKGIVIEFDFTTFDRMPGVSGFSIEGGGTVPTDGSSKVYPWLVGINEDGDLWADYRNATVAEDAIVPGEWIHITVIYDHANFVIKLYADYELLAEYSASCGTSGKHYLLEVIRFNGRSEYGEFSVDNLNVYQGASIRTTNRLEVLSSDEKFNLYCSYLNNEEMSIETRKLAYDLSSKVIGTYWDANGGELDSDGNPTGEYTNYVKNMTDADMKAKLEASVGEFLAFDYDQIIADLSEINRDSFIKMVDDLSKIERSPATLGDRSTAYTNIATFLTDNGSMILKDDLFNEANNILSGLDKEIGYDTNAKNFVLYMTRFELVDSLVGLEKYYGKATELYKDETYPTNEGLYQTYSSDETLAEAFKDFIAAFEKYSVAEEELIALQKTETSKKIIGCLDFIIPYPEEEWFEPETYEYMNRFVLIIRDAITPNDDDSLKYDPEYPGVDEAIEKFTPINDAFYAHLQGIHADFIEEKINLINSTDAYIEKLGAAAFITRYLEENKSSLDRQDETISSLIISYETILQELEYRTEDYAGVLEQNAETFNSYVSQMVYATDYNEKKALFDEATKYYFALDASAEKTQQMIAIYDDAAVSFKKIAAASDEFIVATEQLVAAEDADLAYELLVICYECSLDVDVSYEGVAEALEQFETVYDAYIAAIALDNAATEAALNAVGSLRANGDQSSVASVVVGIVTGK
ncbi:MAG: hypothetical protein IJX38_05385 [Clostridia bacterium]|nr:hypothetical protein [Clostridia bacterium]